jgi:two-component system, NtrC family, nitrogen regulation sensor histidine kinase GlnL
MKLVPGPRVKPETIVDGLTTAVLCLDSGLRVAALNPACESLFGVSLRQAQGQPLATTIPHFAAHVVRLQLALDAGSGFIEREMRLARNGEPPITVDCTVTPVLLGRKPGLLMEVLALDRHLRISRDEWQAAQMDASREMVRGLAHEIKNPLGGIRGAAQLLEREFPDSQHREYTRVIIREVDRLQNLVNRMLGPSRLPQHEPLNVHEVVEHVRRLLQAEAGADIVVTRDYDPSIPSIVGDREQLIQALLNVARNALQAVTTAAGGQRIALRTRTRRQLTLGTRLHRLVVQIDVEDDGPGIAPELIEKIFYPMVTTRDDGTGLGLPIAQYLIHAHGGQIECQSQPGATVFSIYLPLEIT